jgi:hypothetical protein
MYNHVHIWDHLQDVFDVFTASVNGQNTPHLDLYRQKNREFATILALGRNEDVGNMDPSPVMNSL